MHAKFGRQFLRRTWIQLRTGANKKAATTVVTTLTTRDPAIALLNIMPIAATACRPAEAR